MYRFWLLTWLCFSYAVAKRRRKLHGQELPTAQKQYVNCNNCYAVVAYDILKWHRPKLNITVESIMDDSRQNCAGGTAKKIWDLYMSKTIITTANIPKLMRLLKSGPVAIAIERGHLVTAISASKHGVLIRDPRDAKEKVIKDKQFFHYVTYPK
jgi:hypothetical protein